MFFLKLKLMRTQWLVALSFVIPTLVQAASEAPACSARIIWPTKATLYFTQPKPIAGHTVNKRVYAWESQKDFSALLDQSSSQSTRWNADYLGQISSLRYVNGDLATEFEYEMAQGILLLDNSAGGGDINPFFFAVQDSSGAFDSGTARFIDWLGIESGDKWRGLLLSDTGFDSKGSPTALASGSLSKNSKDLTYSFDRQNIEYGGKNDCIRGNVNLALNGGLEKIQTAIGSQCGESDIELDTKTYIDSDNDTSVGWSAFTRLGLIDKTVSYSGTPSLSAETYFNQFYPVNRVVKSMDPSQPGSTAVGIQSWNWAWDGSPQNMNHQLPISMSEDSGRGPDSQGQRISKVWKFDTQGRLTQVRLQIAGSGENQGDIHSDGQWGFGGAIVERDFAYTESANELKVVETDSDSALQAKADGSVPPIKLTPFAQTTWLYDFRKNQLDIHYAGLSGATRTAGNDADIHYQCDSVGRPVEIESAQGRAVIEY